MKQQQQLLERNQSVLSSSAEKENRGTKRKSSIGDDRPKRKSGQKLVADGNRAQHGGMVRSIVLGFINDRGAHKSLYLYCVAKLQEKLGSPYRYLTAMIVNVMYQSRGAAEGGM